MARGLGDILHHFISEADPPQRPSQAAPSKARELGGRETAAPARVSPPDREQLMGWLRERLGDLGLALRVIAEGMLGADSPIDFVTVDPDGRVQLLLVSTQGEDPALVGHALVQRDWVAARLRDWLKLSPELGIRPERGVGVVLLAPSFSSSVIAAAQALEPDAATLVSYRCARDGDPPGVALDTPACPPRRTPVAAAPRRIQAGPERFHTGRPPTPI